LDVSSVSGDAKEQPEALRVHASFCNVQEASSSHGKRKKPKDGPDGLALLSTTLY
jgi:hypothetical protein